jgi:hypothetical protein
MIPLVFCLWGEIGVGKAKLVREVFPKAYYLHDKYFGNYKGQDVAIIEGFPGNISHEELVHRLLNGAPSSIKILLLVSNRPPVEWYGCMMPEIEAMVYYDGSEKRAERFRNLFGIYSPLQANFCSSDLMY